MNYVPGAASLAAAHKGRIKNIRLNTLRDTQQNVDYRSCILDLERETLQHDCTMKENVEGMQFSFVVCDIFYLHHILHNCKHARQHPGSIQAARASLCSQV